MNKLLTTLCTYLLMSTTLCFAGHGLPIRGIATNNVDEIFENGGLILASEKQHSIYMYNTTPRVSGYCNFFVEIHNESPHRETFYFQDLVVTDQWGRRLPVRSKNSVVKRQERENSTRDFFHSLSCAIDSINTEKKAGKVKYKEESRGYSKTKVRTGDRRGTVARTEVRSENYSRIKGEAVDEGMKRLELREMRREHARERAAIARENAVAMSNAMSYYIDNHTLMPDEVYGSNFQVIIPDDILDELEYIYVHYTFAGEKHTFSYRVYTPSYY